MWNVGGICAYTVRGKVCTSTCVYVLLHFKIVKKAVIKSPKEQAKEWSIPPPRSIRDHSGVATSIAYKDPDRPQGFAVGLVGPREVLIHKFRWPNERRCKRSGGAEPELEN